MDNVKKLALVPQNMLAALMSQQAIMAPAQVYISELDREMKRILDDGSIPSDVKAKRYNQALHSFLGFREQELQQPVPQFRQPTTLVPSKERAPAAPIAAVAPTVDFDAIVEHLPKNAKTKGRQLVDHIVHNPDLEWNERSELVYKGETIPNSNATDLINTFLRHGAASAKVPTIAGWKEFGTALIERNAPVTAIGNKAALARLVSTSDSSASQPGTPASAGPSNRQKTPTAVPKSPRPHREKKPPSWFGYGT